MTDLPLRLRAVPAWPRYALAALLQLGAVAWMVAGQAAILRGGVEVTLATAPVDPRDFLRGDYVVLRYAVSTLDPSKLDAFEPVRSGDVVYVRLAPGADGLHEARGLTKTPPPADATQPVLRGRVSGRSACLAREICKSVSVDYGLESYFVPEGEGRVIERLPMNRLRVVAAVAPDGRARIKRLLVDGAMIYEEPPF